MSLETRTTWFDTDKYQLPERIGVYEVRLPWETHGTLPQEYAYWDGMHWGVWSREIHLAKPAEQKDIYTLQKVQWRGLKEEAVQLWTVNHKTTQVPTKYRDAFIERGKQALSELAAKLREEF